jgi:hypothetical protein
MISTLYQNIFLNGTEQEDGEIYEETAPQTSA